MADKDTKESSIKYLGLLLSIIFLQSCLVGSEVSKEASCVDGTAFDTVTRRCIKAAFKPAPPIIETEMISIEEDSVNVRHEIEYMDKNKDIATFCEITDFGVQFFSNSAPACECVAGKCFVYLTPNANLHGETFVSFVLTDKDGRSNEATTKVEVTPVNDTPIIVVPPALGPRRLTYQTNPHFLNSRRKISMESL